MANKTGSRERHYGQKQQPRVFKMENRESSVKEYHSRRWTALSRKFRNANPLCVRCQAKGIIQASEVTDHIVPVEVHGRFWDTSNYQALCKRCNIEKGNEDKRLINEHRKNSKHAN